jgi:hypothetical protein
MVKMAKMASFKPNHKIFIGFAKNLKKTIQKFLEKIKFNENHKDESNFEKKSYFNPLCVSASNFSMYRLKFKKGLNFFEFLKQ